MSETSNSGEPDVDNSGKHALSEAERRALRGEYRVAEPCTILGRTCTLPDCDRPCDLVARRSPEHSPTWEATLDRLLRECGKDGWDSYSARALSPEAVDAARRLLRSLWLVPTVNGGISISFGGESVAFEIDTLGHLDEVYGSGSEVTAWLARNREHQP